MTLAVFHWLCLHLALHVQKSCRAFHNRGCRVRAGDALRPFLLHAFGGMYLDLDVQCFRPSDPWLAGADLVLQSEYKEQRDVVNSVMASVPGHPFWKFIIGQMLSVRGPFPPPFSGVRPLGKPAAGTLNHFTSESHALGPLHQLVLLGLTRACQADMSA